MNPAFKIRFLFIVFAGIMVNCKLLSAQNPDCDRLVSEFQSHLSKGDSTGAKRLIPQIFPCYPEGLARIARPAESLITDSYFNSSFSALSRDQLDTLIRIYDAAIWSEKAESHDFRIRKALLMLQHKDIFKSQADVNLFSCFHSDPDKTPFFIIESVFDIQCEKYRKKEVDQQDLISLWAETDRALTRRSILHPDERNEVQLLEKSINDQMMGLLPPCNKKEKDQKFSHSNGIPGRDEFRNELVVNYLHGCNQGPELSQAISAHKGSADDPYWLRLAAKISDVPQVRIDLLNQAVQLEKNPQIQAWDYIFIGKTLEGETKFREAYQAINKAIELAPRWGAPYMAMADLLVISSFVCSDYGNFDRKAVFWAAMDFVTSGKNADASFNSEASVRMFEYQTQAPSREEVLFRGLKHGDTYPIPCWLGIATTVKCY